MATASISAFKAALLTRLQARPGLAGVQVTWGWPPGDLEPEWIMLGDVDGTQAAAALGAQRREEEYFLDVTISVVRDMADDPRETADRAFALAAEVEDELRGDASLGGVVREAQVIADGLVEPADGNQREARIPMRIRARKRI
ncbi:MAG: hypothetical protein AB1416_12030 [Actinomycetota bacterium]